MYRLYYLLSFSYVWAFQISPSMRSRMPPLAMSSSTTSSTATQSIPWPTDAAQYGPFDQDKTWAWVYTTVTPEAASSYAIDDIEGTIPADLDGIFYRAGPGNFERNNERYKHVLDGDGFLAAITLKDGQASYQGRFVETEFFREEVEANEVRYRNVFGTDPKGMNAFNLKLKNVANTNVVRWGDRLFVLWEGGRPYELDTETLETLPMTDDGPFVNLGGSESELRGVTVDHGGAMDQLLKFGRFFTAHPHVLGDKLVAFKAAQNAQTKDIEMEFVEYDSEWKQVHAVRYDIPRCASPPHDFSLNENVYGFFQNSLALNSLAFILGLKAPTEAMELELERPAVLHLVPRNDRKPVQVEIPNYFNIHMVPKIRQEGNKVIIYSNGWDLTDPKYFPEAESMPFLGSWGGRYPDFDIVPPTMLYRTIVDTETGNLVSHEEVNPGTIMEWPMEDDDYIYYGISSTDYTNLPTTGVCRLDPATGRQDYWYAEGNIFVGEPMPITKRNGDPGSWLLNLFYDAGNKRTSLAIFDSEKVANGPVARVHLRYPVSYGLHNWFHQAS